MYTSLQHFNEFGAKKIEKVIKSFIEERKDIADLVYGIQGNLYELGRNIITEVLEDMDECLRKDRLRVKEWEIVRREATTILTTFGNVKYNRTYYKSKKNKEYKHLVDEIAGLEPHDRVSTDVVITTIEEAIESSYKKAGRKASYEDEITKQAVMKKVHGIEIKDAPINNKEKKEVKILYIEADEDHVPLQNKKNPKRDKRKKDKEPSYIMPKIVYVHEGIDNEKSTAKRKCLKNVRYFGGIINPEDLWIKVADYINKCYKEETIETIYISGDGAPWIRQGTQWIMKSRYVLDKYHLNKYIKAATAHFNDDRTMYYTLKDEIDYPDKKAVKRVFKKILNETESETKQHAIKNARRYILKNWDGIVIQEERGHEIVGCSAEGHVSHILSDRLSSRPKGWSVLGADQISRLRIYTKNGGKIYDLVMAQKMKKEKEKKIKIQEEMIKNLRNVTDKYGEAVNTNITAIDIGRRTGLYRELRNQIGWR